MKKNIIFLAVLIIVMAGSFYGGMRYQSSRGSARGQFTAGFLNFNNLSAEDRQKYQEMGGRRVDTAQVNANFVNGEIIGRDDQSIIIKLNDGGSKIIFYSASTAINKMASGVFEDLSVGTSIMVTGKTGTDGSLTAETIQIRSGAEPLGPGMVEMVPKQ